MSQLGHQLAGHLDALERSIDANVRSLAASSRAYDALARSAERASAAVASIDLSKLSGSGSGGSGKGTGPAAADVGGSLAAGLAPLGTAAQKVVNQLDAIGGTVVTLARRIDSSMKKPFFENLIEKGLERVESGFGRVALSAVKAGFAIKNWWGNLGDVAGKGLDRVSKIAGSFRAITAPAAAATTSVKHLGIQIAAAFGATALAYKLGQGIKDFFVSGVKGASDLNESTSKVRTVFGTAGREILTQADVMATKFGTVKSEYIEGAIGISNMGKAARLSNRDAVALGNTFARLGQDLMSQDNLPFAEAMEKLRSGLAGEAEPLRRFGVLLDEATVKSHAYANGIAKAGAELTAAQKVQARSALIQAGLARVNGDLSATITSPANAYRRFTGILTNLAASVGTAFMPAIQKGIGLLTEFATWATAAFENKQGAVKEFVDRLVYGLGTVEIVFKNLPTVMEMFWLKVHEVFTNFDAIVATIMPNFQIISKYVHDNWARAVVDAFNVVQVAMNNLAVNLYKLGSAWVKFAKGDLHAFDKIDFTPILDGFKATVDELPKLIKPAFVSLQGEIDALWDGIDRRQSSWLGGALAGVAEAAKGAAEAVREPAAEAAKKAEGGKADSNAALSFGSSESVSAIAKFLNDARDEPLKVARESLGVQRKMAASIDRLNRIMSGGNDVVANPIA